MFWPLLLLLNCRASVLTLDGRNFTWALRAHPRLLIFFFSPWCGHSRQLEPEVHAAAELLEGSVACARVDASLEVEVADEFGLNAYPGLFLLQKGSYEEFTGRRSAQAIADWARSKIGSALQLLKDSTELRAALQRGGVSAVVARGSAALRELLQRLAERHRAWGRFLFVPAGRPSVQVHRGIDEVVEGPEIDLEREGLEKELWEFLEGAQLPLFGEVNEENFYHYETSGAEGLLWVVFANSSGLPCSAQQCLQQAVEHRETFRSLAIAAAGLKVVYVDAVAHQDYVMGELGVNQVPVLLLQKGTKSAIDGPLQTWSYSLRSGTSLEAIQLWLKEVWG